MEEHPPTNQPSISRRHVGVAIGIATAIVGGFGAPVGFLVGGSSHNLAIEIGASFSFWFGGILEAIIILLILKFDLVGRLVDRLRQR